MAVTGQLTLDEFLRLPEEKPAREYDQGVISQKMPPMAWHGKIQFLLAMRFEQYGHPVRLLSAFTETRVTWTDQRKSYVPDVIAYLIQREPVEPDGYITKDFTVPPDVAVEVWSEGQVLGHQMDRCRWYVQHDVPVALLVHPNRQQVWTFRTGAETGPHQGTDAIDLGDVVPGLSFSVAELFAGLRSSRR
jgi:Uma2 family endonuclease